MTVQHARDIDNADFVFAILTVGARKRTRMTLRWDVQAELEIKYGPIPEKIITAKARRLIDSGLIEGCCCGCRGDYEVRAVTARALGFVADASDGRSGTEEPYGVWVPADSRPAWTPTPISAHSVAGFANAIRRHFGIELSLGDRIDEFNGEIIALFQPRP